MIATESETKDLESAGVSHQGLRPGHEFMQSPVRLNDLFARLQMQMKGVANNKLCARSRYFLARHRFDRRLGAYRHVRRGFHLAMGRFQNTKPRTALLGFLENLKFEH